MGVQEGHQYLHTIPYHNDENGQQVIQTNDARHFPALVHCSKKRHAFTPPPPPPSLLSSHICFSCGPAAGETATLRKLASRAAVPGSHNAAHCAAPFARGRTGPRLRDGGRNNYGHAHV